MTDIWIDIFAITCLVGVFAYGLYIVYYALGLYDINPFYRPIPLSQEEKEKLRHYFPYLKSMGKGTQTVYFKRVAWFRAKKAFVFKHQVNNQALVKLLLSGAVCYLTIGFRRYKMIRSIHRIVLHPKKYYSNFNRRYHLGEYHPGLKVVALSEDTVHMGFADTTDNRNLAIHEFAHAVYFETKDKNSWEALRFQWGFRKLKRLFANEAELKRIMDSGYFRPYGKTNVFEFLSVLTENFVETPEEFMTQFPVLFGIVSKMYNQHPLVDAYEHISKNV